MITSDGLVNDHEAGTSFTETLVYFVGDWLEHCRFLKAVRASTEQAGQENSTHGNVRTLATQ
jgi:hypothetical protein